MNETLKTIKSRRSVRSFKEQQIRDTELQVVLEAAQYAPNAGAQTWQFVAVQNKELINELSNASKEAAKNHEVKRIL
jgi:nitroreductase